MPGTNLTDLREQLAAIEHQRWADWQRWMHDQGRTLDDGALVIPAELVARWERQIQTPYDALSDAEKQSDRDQVDRYWPLLLPLLSGATTSAPAPALVEPGRGAD